MDRNVLFSLSTTSAVLSLAINSFFIYISCKKERNNMGAYRYFLVAFASCNILYSSVEYIAKPVNFIYGHSMLSFNNGIVTNVPALDPLFIALFFSVQGIESALLVLHFLYRYIAVCRPEKKMYFERPNVAIWAAFNLIWGLIYFFIALYWFEPTKECYEYAGKAVRDTFHRDLYELPHICLLTYEIIDNSLFIYWKPTTGMTVITLMMITTIVAMIYLGVQISRTLKRTALSKKTITLQRQMLISLTIQALLPCVLAFIARFIMIFSVVMGLSIPSAFKYLPLITTFTTTVIDPVAIMLTIKDYRSAVFKMIMRVHATSATTTTTTVKVCSSHLTATSPSTNENVMMNKQ